MQRSGPASAPVSKGCSNNIQPPPPPTRTDATITATCTSVCKERDCCIVLCWSWSVVVVIVVECCCWISYRIALTLDLTFTPSVLTFAPCTLTFAHCAGGVILLSTNTSTRLAHMVVVTGYNLCCFLRNSFSHSCKHSLHLWWCHPL